jgi:hypothetical protein
MLDETIFLRQISLIASMEMHCKLYIVRGAYRLVIFKVLFSIFLVIYQMIHIREVSNYAIDELCTKLKTHKTDKWGCKYVLD